MQSPIDIEGAIQTGVIDQALPPHCRPGFFKIYAHDNHKGVSIFFRTSRKALAVVNRCSGIVDAAGPNHYHQPIVQTVQNVVYSLPRLGNMRSQLFIDSDIREQRFWRN